MDSALALRRLQAMVAYSTDPVLSTEDVEMLLKAARREDSAGFMWDNPQWVPTYNLVWAAREGWTWKAGASADRYKIISDNTEINRNQVHQHCLKLADYYGKRLADSPQVLRSRGNLVVDRTGAYSAIPWWWEESGN